jgi:Holliday junction resolvase RusA-like endonuclease
LRPQNKHMLAITVHGMPGPQGSKKLVGRDGKGRGILVESSKKVKPWREAVRWAAIEAMGGAGRGVMGPVAIDMIFTLPKPKSAPKRAKTYPSRKPDLSKLVRSTEDALTDVGAIEDDARIVCISAQKVFPGEGIYALAVPGVLIRISSYPDK